MSNSQNGPRPPPVTSVEQVIKLFEISDESLRTIKLEIAKELELGLKNEDEASIKMLITYVRELSRGDETGSYLALDLGGTHFRVLLVDLNEGQAKVTTAVHDIPQPLLTTQNGQELFDYIALKLLEFVQKNKLRKRRISLGFTFSFPCKQYGLTQSVLVKWCKGFQVGGVVGTDVVKQLKDALKRQLAGLVEAYIDVVAVINDTTGTLVACANSNPNCCIGLIVGTGYNVCYMEQLDKCDKWPANYTSPKQVIINCEWGAMGDHKERRQLDKFRNEFDFEVDRKSVNPNNQTYEKMVSGLYLGELLRLALVKLYKSKLLFVKTPDVVGGGSSASTSNASSRSVSPNNNQRRSRSRSKSANRKRAKTSPAAGSSTSSTTNEQLTRTSSNSSCSSLSSARARSTSSTGSSAFICSPATSSTGAASSSSYISSVIDNMTTTGSPHSTLTNSSGPTPPPGSSAAGGSQAPSPSPAPPTPPLPPPQHKLYVKDVFDGRHFSLLAKDELSGSFEEATKILKELNITNYEQKDLQALVQLSSVIINRSANLVASGISALLERLKRPQAVVGYDGSVIKCHPYFLKKLNEKCALLTGKKHKFDFMLSSDGSGIGAAVVAAALHKERSPLYVVKGMKLYEMHFPNKAQQSNTGS